MRRFLFLFAVCCLLRAEGVARADDGPDYSAFVVGTYLSFPDGAPQGGFIDSIPHLMISFGDGPPHRAQMDTGSTGLVVSADQVPDLTGGAECKECLTYSSSGRILSGVWVKTPVTIRGANQASVTTTPIPVLAVTAITCTDRARNCTKEDNPKGVDLIGVGFAREQDLMPMSTPDTNPFLNVASSSDGQARRGYIVTRFGVHVGLTRKNTQGDFHFVKLANANIEGEWQAAPACITVGAAPPACGGSVLVDTGVTAMFLTTGSADGGGQPASGTRLTFTFPDAQGKTAATYGFVVDPLAPQTIYPSTKRSAPFVNTSVHFLNGFDVLYDADGGFFAYRPRP